jgi:thioredoxin reductase (NADPH)
MTDAVEKLIIIGSGPAGWTAALYAARASLNPVVYVGVPRQNPSLVLPGGQLMLTTDVENYPGFPEGVTGPEMMALFQKQAERFGTRIVGDEIEACDFKASPLALRTASGTVARARAVILATGATANWLGLPNELRLAQAGGGVSACAVCDGALPLFRNQPLAVVGGGDTAMEEASYLAKFGSTIHLIHRRGAFRASKAMQERIFSLPNVRVHWNQVVADVLGAEQVAGVRLRDVETGAESELAVKGLFVAIGHTPATAFLAGSGVELTETGYVMLRDRSSRTNIEGVFAAGDVADSTYRQAVTAAGMGCQAALDAERWLSAQGVH